jgi:hypothetical protein
VAGPTSSKSGPPLLVEEGDRRRVERARAADDVFVKAVLPLLDAGARERAAQVRVKAGDPVAALVAPRRHHVGRLGAKADVV